MRHRTLISALAPAALCILTALGCAAAARTPKVPTGKVTITFNLTRIRGTASNQYAVWIEDGAGKFVRTLFVTNYMARREGWKTRRESLVTWVKAADVKNLPKEAIDAVSFATPQTGPQSVVWDLRDAAGAVVAAGTYTYKVEASLLWANTALYTGSIRIGGKGDSSKAALVLFPAGADTLKRTLVSDVAAVYDPAP